MPMSRLLTEKFLNKMDSDSRILVYGYGNPGRQDDGLGAAFIQMLENWLVENPFPQISTDCNYQLNIEDAAAVSDKTLVVFVDASQEAIEDYSFTKVEASDARVEFSMHAVSTSFVIDLCQKIYGKVPEAWLLHIRGYEWDFKEELTQPAQRNLELAFGFLTKFLDERRQEILQSIEI
jgi:hydrogenase maturation protease